MAETPVIKSLRAVPVADVEEITQHFDRGALLALAEQRRDRYSEVLAKEIEQSRFHRRHRVDGRAEVEGL